MLDIGSLDINGCFNFLFHACEYTGLDLGPGPNVDAISVAHEYDAPDESFDVVISSQALEHDMHWRKTLAKAYQLVRPNGLLAFSCANPLGEEHGTITNHPDASPFTVRDPVWAHYYQGLTEEDIRSVWDVETLFSEFYFMTRDDDLYFYGIKIDKAEVAS